MTASSGGRPRSCCQQRAGSHSHPTIATGFERWTSTRAPKGARADRLPIAAVTARSCTCDRFDRYESRQGAGSCRCSTRAGPHRAEAAERVRGKRAALSDMWYNVKLVSIMLDQQADLIATTLAEVTAGAARNPGTAGSGSASRPERRAREASPPCSRTRLSAPPEKDRYRSGERRMISWKTGLRPGRRHHRAPPRRDTPAQARRGRVRHLNANLERSLTMHRRAAGRQSRAGASPNRCARPARSLPRCKAGGGVEASPTRNERRGPPFWRHRRGAVMESDRASSALPQSEPTWSPRRNQACRGSDIRLRGAEPAALRDCRATGCGRGDAACCERAHNLIATLKFSRGASRRLDVGQLDTAGPRCAFLVPTTGRIRSAIEKSRDVPAPATRRPNSRAPESAWATVQA